MQETWIWSRDQEDPLEEEMATHSSILSRRIPWTEETGRLQSIVSQRVRHDWSDSIAQKVTQKLLYDAAVTLLGNFQKNWK